jgi:WD40 repeat protein
VTLIEKISPRDARRLARGGEDGTLQIVRLEGQEYVEEGAITCTAHTGPISALAWSPSGQAIATGGADGRVCVWETLTGMLLETFPFQEGRSTVTALAWLDDSALAASADNELSIFTIGVKQVA